MKDDEFVSKHDEFWYYFGIQQEEGGLLGVIPGAHFIHFHLNFVYI